MKTLKMIICLVAIYPIFSMADTNPECLKHRGGAFADVECFQGLSGELVKENSELLNKLEANIPEKNSNKNLLKKYVSHQGLAKKYCELHRASSTKWVPEKRPANPRYYVYDVEYYECLYDLLQQENLFLKKLLQNSTER